jgi:hypothetical protein
MLVDSEHALLIPLSQLRWCLGMDLESPLKIALAIFTFGTTLYFIRIQSLKRVFPRNLPLPPGPPRRFLLGSALELPTKNQCITYHEWAKEYGRLSNTILSKS